MRKTTHKNAWDTKSKVENMSPMSWHQTFENAKCSCLKPLLLKWSPVKRGEMEVAACFPESNQNEGPSATLQRRYEWVQNLASSTHYATMQSKYTTSDSQHGKDMYIGQAVLLSAICVSRIKGKRLEPSCPLGPTGRRWLLRSPNKCVQYEWKTSL